MKTVFSIVFGFAFLVLGINYWFASRGYEGPISDHFDGEKFYNAQKAQKASFWDFLYWITHRNPGKWPDQVDNPPYPLPQTEVLGDKLHLTFVGHASFLIQTQGLNILTDPIWSKRCSPISFIGPKRVRQPGVQWENLPPIHWAIISHNHYDHLDVHTLKALYKRDQTRFIVGLGNQALLIQNGIPASHIIELDWWQNYSTGFMTFTSVPGEHFSGRALTDRNKTLWMGVVIKTHKHNLYFAGDTGFGPHFEAIHTRLGAPDIALLPIGAFQPIWFMRPVHISPKEAVLAAKALKAKHSFGMHFGTFALADDGFDEPVIQLQKALLKHPEINFQVPNHGEVLQFD